MTLRLVMFGLLCATGCSTSPTPPAPSTTAPASAMVEVPADRSDAYPTIDLVFEVSSPEQTEAHRQRSPADVASLRVVVAGAPKLEGHLLVASGYLVNDGDTPVLLDNGGASPGTELSLAFSPDAHVERRPPGSSAPPPPAPPPLQPRHTTLPPRTRARIKGWLLLDGFAYPPGKPVDITWQLYRMEAKGVWRGVKMPADGPRGEIPIPIAG